MAFDQGAPQFGVKDCKIATWNSAGSYGTLQDVMSIQMMGSTLQFASAQLTGDDEISAADSRLVGGRIQMRFGGLNLDSLAILTGKSIGTISSVEQVLFKGGDVMPYIGILGKFNAAEGGGDTWVWCPKGKIMDDFTLIQGEYGTFATPEVTVQLVSDSSYGILNPITHATALDISVFPPANIAPIS